MISDTTQLPPTLAASDVPLPVGSLARATGSSVRTTVLPRVADDGSGVQLTTATRDRYEPKKILGAGGMGEVVLVRDHDIGRHVAVKRMLPAQSDPADLVRFVDEIRTVGRLEHPNIVPIHDVGLDERGRYFFVMKYVDGETLESIIGKLRAGDPEYLAKYSIEVRIELFIGLLHALEYAHAAGVVHRDVKPANVMVGRYGEVVLMDWGIAKPIAAERDPAAGADGEIAGDDDRPRARMFATRVGSLIGTPAYMSPEQAGEAAGARSDVYSAVVLLHELIGLRHYLEDKPDVTAVLTAILGEAFGFFKLRGLEYPPGHRPPAELLHLFVRGLSKDPSRRFGSAAELIAALHEILEGKVRVRCHITFTKRSFRELGRLVDRRPYLAFFVLLGLAAATIFAGIQLVRGAVAGL